MAWTGSRLIADRVNREADEHLLQAAEQAALVLDRVVAERERQVRLLASLPGAVDAARLAAREAARRGLPGQPIESLERRFDSTRTLDVDPRTRQFFLARASSLDLAEVLLTDLNGFNAITTERTSDFVQSDEAWWREALDRGLSPAAAEYDESVRRLSISVSAAVREGEGAPAVGVMKVVYGLAALQNAVSAASTEGVIAVEVIDRAGRIIASSRQAGDLTPLRGHATLPEDDRPTTLPHAEGARRTAVRPTNGTAWRVVAHTPVALAQAELRGARLWLGVVAVAVFLLVLGGLAAMNRFLHRRIALPAALLAATAESVAAGNLAVRLNVPTADDEIGRLGRATRAMVQGLRDLTIAIRTSAGEAARMAGDLTASAEEMAASSQHMAQASTGLSRESGEMAQTIQAMVEDSTQLVESSSALASGVTEGVARNHRLRTLAQENRERLDRSAQQLEALIGEVERNVVAAEALTAASKEIREFIAQVQYLARQSTLVAYSAGVEASRAGPEGAGFGVVAKEVQRLADSSSKAAERTEKVVLALLAKVEETRASSARSAEAVASVRDATQQGLASFGQVEAAVADMETWTRTIEAAAVTANRVVQDAKRRLETLARGTELFASAMQEVAASAQEQSASTQEIVSTATALAATAHRLTEQAQTFRLE